jgi:ankyrin repeat protein
LDYLGRTPLFQAAKNNYLRPVKALLAGGAKPGIKNNQDQSSIDVCTNL